MDETCEFEDEVSEEIEENNDLLVEELTNYCKLYHLPIFNHPNLINLLNK